MKPIRRKLDKYLWAVDSEFSAPKYQGKQFISRFAISLTLVGIQLKIIFENLSVLVGSVPHVFSFKTFLVTCVRKEISSKSSCFDYCLKDENLSGMSGSLSEYELLRLKNIKRNHEFMKSLGEY